MDNPNPTNKVAIIKNLYLYLVSFVALMIMIFSTADILNIVMRTWLFPKADQAYYYAPVICEAEPATTTPDGRVPKEGCMTEEQAKRENEMRTAQKQRDLVRDISMLLVAAPVFAFHWRIIRRREEV